MSAAAGSVLSPSEGTGVDASGVDAALTIACDESSPAGAVPAATVDSAASLLLFEPLAAAAAAGATLRRTIFALSLGATPADSMLVNRRCRVVASLFFLLLLLLLVRE